MSMPTPARSPIPARILRAHELGAFQQAAGALAAARAEAIEIRSAARRAGFAEGRAEAMAATTRMMAEATAGIRRQLAGLEAAMAAAIADGVAAVLGAVPCAERVALAAATAVADLQDRSRLVVRVAPGAVAAVRVALQGAAETLVVLVDPAMADDGCVVEGAGGRIEASIAGQVAALRAGLGLADAPRPDPAP